MNKLIFIFFDGVGIGKSENTNPFFLSKSKYLPFYSGNNGLPGGIPIKAIDARLGVEGVPQSASGQTSLYTGENLPQILNRHKDSFPNRLMRKIIHEKNILLQLKNLKLRSVFFNAYPIYSHFFTSHHIRIEKEGELTFSDQFPTAFKRRISVTTCMMVTSLQTPFNENDILAERSLFQDFTNRWLVEKGIELPEFSPEKAAEILYNASKDHDFLLFEYFQTDLYAHRRNIKEQLQLIEELDRFIGKLISIMDANNETLLLTSDHGNLEDSTIKNHTQNPVPLLTWGCEAQILRNSINQITDVTPTIVKLFSASRKS